MALKKLTWSETVELIKILRIDLFFALSMMAMSIPSVTFNQLAQDKYCLNEYGYNESICLDLQNVDSELAEVRNKVLKDSTNLKLYTTMLTTIPDLFFSLFVGYWIDTFPGHLRYLLCFSSLTYLLGNAIIIYQCFYFTIAPLSLLYGAAVPAFTGSTLIAQIGVFTYTTLKTPPKYRAMRFTILEVFLFVSLPFSSIIGGKVLAMDPWFSDQKRNYIGVYLISMLFSLIAAIWIVIMLYDSIGATPQQTEAVGTDEHDQSNNGTSIEAGSAERTEKVKALPKKKLNCTNSLQTLETVFKNRPNNIRLALLTSTFSGIIATIGYMGETSIGFQFAQRVYHWSYETYSYIGSIIIISPAIGTLVGTPLLINYYGLHDTTVSIIGCVSIIIAYLCKGLILNQVAVFSMVFACFAALLPVTGRSILSKMIPNEEIGQIYAFSGAIGAFAPLLSSTFFTRVFAATIDSNPGLIYVLAGLLYLLPCANYFWLYSTKDSWDLSLQRNTKPEPSEQQPDQLTNIPLEEIS